MCLEVMILTFTDLNSNLHVISTTPFEPGLVWMTRMTSLLTTGALGTLTTTTVCHVLPKVHNLPIIGRPLHRRKQLKNGQVLRMAGAGENVGKAAVA